MARTRLLAIPILAALTLLIGALPGRAAGTYQNTVTMHLPPRLSQLTSFDISFVDSNSSTFVFTDRNNKSVDVFDTKTDRFIRNSDPIFFGLGAAGGGGCKTGSGPNTNAGNNGGPNGVVIISNNGRGDEDRGERHDAVALNSLADRGHVWVSDDDDRQNRGRAWAGDGNSTVKVIDLNSGKQVGTDIPTGGTCRADELWNDPEDHEIVIGNPNDSTVDVHLDEGNSRS